MNNKYHGRESFTLFIVDDDVILRYLKTFFTKGGWNVEIFYGAEEILERVEQKASLIVTDLDMPEMDGIRLIQNIKAILNFSDLAVLVMTSLRKSRAIPVF